MDQSKQTWPSNNKTITHRVFSIKMGDVEDPDLMVAQYIYEWQQTNSGKWIMKNSSPPPSWYRSLDVNSYGYLYEIRAYLEPKKLTYWKLKFE